MLPKDAWNIVLILLAVIGAIAVIGFVGWAQRSSQMEPWGMETATRGRRVAGAIERRIARDEPHE